MFNQIATFSQLFAPRGRNVPGVVPGSEKGRPRRPEGAKRLPKGIKKSWKRHPKGFHKASKCNKQVPLEFYSIGNPISNASSFLPHPHLPTLQPTQPQGPRMQSIAMCARTCFLQTHSRCFETVGISSFSHIPALTYKTRGTDQFAHYTAPTRNTLGNSKNRQRLAIPLHIYEYVSIHTIQNATISHTSLN